MLGKAAAPALACAEVLVMADGKSAVVKVLGGGFVTILLGLCGCFPPGPSEERLGCLQGCAGEKDQCMLEAMTAPAIQACDARASACSGTCPE
jgi:hypothetical protein